MLKLARLTWLSLFYQYVHLPLFIIGTKKQRLVFKNNASADVQRKKVKETSLGPVKS